MRQAFHDPRVEGQQMTVCKPLMLLHLGALLYSLYLLVMCIPLNQSIIAKSSYLLAATVMVYNLFNALRLLIDGRRIVRSIKLDNQDLLITNLMGWERRVSYKHIDYLSCQQPRWQLGRSTLFDDQQTSVVLYLRCGRFYRISRSMTQLPLLVQQLKARHHRR